MEFLTFGYDADKKVFIRRLRLYAQTELSVRQHSAYRLFICAVNQCGLPQPHFTARSLFGKNMTQILAAAFELAASCHLKALGSRSSGLDFWHFNLLAQ